MNVKPIALGIILSLAIMAVPIVSSPQANADDGLDLIPVEQVTFSWAPFKETTKYKFVLAKDAAMTQIVKEAEVMGTSYVYEGTLEYSTNYFWRVMSLEPAPSDWSATMSFRTEAAPPQPAEPQTQTQPISWPLALTIVIILTILLSAGLITWLVAVRRNKAA
ncbi:MAG: fibronectin type III domain-containing protein [Chloroflexota bacterium]|nr:MAG: fibronectin type III domain-containing protein [Chloroflexota bacterium]